MKKRVLFVCTGNSARSIMAEALLRHQAGDRFEVQSAGTRPSGVDARTLEALDAFAIGTENLRSKPMEEVSHEQFDFVITLCQKAAGECRHWPGGGVVMDWDFPDPADSRDPLAFRHAVREISERIKLFVLVNSKHGGSGIASLSALEFFKCLGDETRLLSLLLIEQSGELCVCELVEALDMPQPRVSRHLALLRNAGLLLDHRRGQWVYYRLHPMLEPWMADILRRTGENTGQLLDEPLQRLSTMTGRPGADPCKSPQVSPQGGVGGVP